MNGSVRVPHPIVVLHGGGVALACGLNGQLRAEALHGLFAGDTRVLSTYQLAIGDQPWQVLSRTLADHGTARWEYQNPLIHAPLGPLPAGTLLLSLERRLDGALRDELQVRVFDRPVRVSFTLELDADFADIFEVRQRSLPPRLAVGRLPTPDGLLLVYTRDGFRRGLRLTFHAGDARPSFVGSLVIFDLFLPVGGEWRCTVEANPELGDEILTLPSARLAARERVLGSPLRLRTAAVLERPFARGRADLHALAIPQGNQPPYVAAGVPWFLTLFGRDTLVTALMAGLDGAWSAEGALAALGALQATTRDDWRDAEPGKLPHELRRGELAWEGRIPHTPYYGSHDAPALYCMTLWNAWRWTGEPGLLDAHLDTARAALHWCEQYGDRDGDGLLEYGTRSPVGYYNQSWKDAGDAIVEPDGSLAALPLATVEMQGYLFAARLAMAELLEARGERDEAARLRQAARELRGLVEARFWLPDQQFYALALDGAKRPVASVASNPGHLLWCGLPSLERAAAVGQRLLAPDMFSGWGLRTLSTENRAYNPLSYQRGSVWPHDTLLAAAGLWRYGLRDEASALIRAILQAAAAFEEERLPELFCGLSRAGGPPVPYEAANSPQAWSAAAPLLAAQLFLGLVPDAPRGRCFVAPWLPDWLPRLELRGIRVGQGSLNLVAVRRGLETIVERHQERDVEAVVATPEAVLWGAPPWLA